MTVAVNEAAVFTTGNGTDCTKVSASSAKDASMATADEMDKGNRATVCSA